MTTAIVESPLTPRFVPLVADPALVLRPPDAWLSSAAGSIEDPADDTGDDMEPFFTVTGSPRASLFVDLPIHPELTLWPLSAPRARARAPIRRPAVARRTPPAVGVIAAPLPPSPIAAGHPPTELPAAIFESLVEMWTEILVADYQQHHQAAADPVGPAGVHSRRQAASFIPESRS